MRSLEQLEQGIIDPNQMELPIIGTGIDMCVALLRLYSVTILSYRPYLELYSQIISVIGTGNLKKY